MAGIDIPIPELQLVIHIPTIKDIAYMGESKFFMAVQYLCLDKEALIQDENLLSSLTNFQVLMKVLEQSQDKEKKEAIITLLKLLFPDYIAILTKNSIILKIPSQEQTILIDNDNFELFQGVIKQVLCVNSIFQGDNVIYNPANEAAKKIADKLMRGRRKVAELKSKGNNESVLTRYISILTIGTNTMNLEACTNLNLFQLFDLMERYNAFIDWDTDLKIRLQGGSPDRQVESWMRDLHSQTTTTTTAFTKSSIPSGMKVY